jgi:hypothetical protein
MDKKYEEVMIGGYFPQSSGNLLDLHAVRLSMTRSDLLRAIVHEWLDKRRKAYFVDNDVQHFDVLIESIALGIQKEIQQFLSVLSAEEKKQAIQAHLYEEKGRLLRRLPEDVVEKIMEEVTFEKDI